MKIVLLGPIQPYRGGLAQFTAILANNLAKKHDVKILSYKRLYPPFLYPGASEKDSISKFAIGPPTNYIIDVLNPWTWLKAFKMIKGERADLLIVQWAVYFFSYFYVPILKLVRRFTKTKILFDCHNILPHEKRFFAHTLTKFGLRVADCFLVHSDKDLVDLANIITNPKVRKALIPVYEGFNIGTINRNEARQDLGIDGNVVLFFGLIREYKGVMYLIKSLPVILEKLGVTLVIAGEFWDDKKKYLKAISENGLDRHVKIIDRYIPNEEVEKYFQAADVVVLPYTSATQTAVIPLAVSFNKPVICTNVGGLPELVHDDITGMVVPPKDEKALAEAVIAFFENGMAVKFEQNIKKNKEEFSWERMIGTIESLVQQPAEAI